MEMFAKTPYTKEQFMTRKLSAFMFIDEHKTDFYTRYSLSGAKEFDNTVLYLYDYGFTLWYIHPQLGEMFILERTFPKTAEVGNE